MMGLRLLLEKQEKKICQEKHTSSFDKKAEWYQLINTNAHLCHQLWAY